MADPLRELRPRAVWSRFAEIAAIPRPSGHEAQVAAWVRSIAAERSWEIDADATGNLVARVPSSPGRERAPTVVLQAHLDMVCEKNQDVSHDFLRDPIRPRVVGEWVQATGTTLGADNGLGVAAALAAAADREIEHGPLELLFTVEEETGLTGARSLDGGLLRGRRLLNLDSEEDGTLFVGCAGGANTRLELPVQTVPPACGPAFRIDVQGLRGGHSGLQIHENRGNAVKLLARLLLGLIGEGVDFELAALTGGDKHNAIPREALALLQLAPGQAARFERVVENFRSELKVEFGGIDDGARVRVGPAPAAGAVLARADRDRLLRLLAVLPHGVLGMSRDIPGLVETSSNLAAVALEEGTPTILTSTRGNAAPQRAAVLLQIASAGALAGARVTTDGGYPGWKPRMDSPLLATVRAVFSDVWGRPPHVTAVHAGLECALLGEKVPGMDMISFGPQIEGAHSPDERVSIPSVERFWQALGCTLKTLASAPADPS